MLALQNRCFLGGRAVVAMDFKDLIIPLQQEPDIKAALDRWA